jgi:hypothetical protein
MIEVKAKIYFPLIYIQKKRLILARILWKDFYDERASRTTNAIVHGQVHEYIASA